MFHGWAPKRVLQWGADQRLLSVSKRPPDPMPCAKHLTYMSHVYPMAMQSERHWNCLHLIAEEARLRGAHTLLALASKAHTRWGWLFKADLLDSTKEVTYPSPLPSPQETSLKRKNSPEGPAPRKTQQSSKTSVLPPQPGLDGTELPLLMLAQVILKKEFVYCVCH